MKMEKHYKQLKLQLFLLGLFYMYWSSVRFPFDECWIVSTIEENEPSLLSDDDLKNWMSRLSDYQDVRDITIPGSHDSLSNSRLAYDIAKNQFWNL